jgi:hypothetical protein
MGIPWIGELVHAYFHRDHNKMTDCDLTFEVGYLILISKDWSALYIKGKYFGWNPG